MEKGKKKRSSHGRKRRLQLDEEEGSYSKNYSKKRTSEPSTSTRNSVSLRSATLSASGTCTGGSVRTSSIFRSSVTSTAALPSSVASSGGNSSTVTESKDTAKTPPVNQNISCSTSESAGTASSPQRPGSASPDPNCAICLGKLENKSFTDSCFHQFCFVCLVEWSKVKAECPLCKQSFKSIVHNVRSYDDYDQYHIPTPEERNHMHELPIPGVRFRYRTTVTDHRYASVVDRISREIESRLLQRPSRSLPIPNYRRLRQPANSEFRRNIYLQRLKLDSEQLNTRRRVRETSPTFFRDNPAQTHRLVPWLNRELNALLQGHGEQTAFVLDLIMGLIKRFPIDSEEFYQHVFPYFGRHTRQFMHEFLMFAKSPYHMAAYDRHSSYVASDEPHHDSDSDTDQRQAASNDGNDSDVIVVSPGNSPVPGNSNSQPPPPRREDSNLDTWESVLTARDPYLSQFAPIIRTHGFEDLTSVPPYTGLRDYSVPTSASGWDSPTPGPSQLRLHIPYLEHSSSSTGYGNSGCIWTPASRSFSAPTCQLLQSSSSNFGNLFANSLNLVPRNPPVSTSNPLVSQRSPVVFHSDSDSNSSDVEIVEVEKPWVERSPIHVSSGGETDYDVMITGTTHVNDPIKTEKKKKKHKRRHDESSAEPSKEKHRRSSDKSRERHSKKKQHRSRSRSPWKYSSQSKSRTRSLSPLRLTIFRAPEYQHKKFGYRTQSGKPDKMLTYHESRSRSRSVSSFGSDSESHVSITSHRRSSKSKHSSIEIVEYRKKSSKLKKKKKHKKNKGKDIATEGNSDLELFRSHKHKKHSKSLTEQSPSESLGSHKRNKHKSKKKKHHKDKKQSGSKSKEGRDCSSPVISSDNADLCTDKRKSALPIYTSDSDPDSISGTEGEASKKNTAEYVVNSSAISPARVDFVELDPEQITDIDQELNSINRTLAKNDYINTLLRGDNTDKNETEEKYDTNEKNDPNALNLRLFKKHPYGHKKSSKPVQNKSASHENTNLQDLTKLITSCASGSNVAVSKSEDNIQSHDISSCSDIDSLRQLPSFLTFSNRNAGFNTYQNPLDFLDNSQGRYTASSNRCPATMASYDSPTSSGLQADRENERTSVENSEENNFVDVDSISDDSDIDIMGETLPVVPNGVDNYQISYQNLNPFDKDKNFIDVVGDSDDEHIDKDNENGEAESESVDSNNERSHSSKDVDFENEDSDIECSLIEGHKTFEIAEDSDCEIKNISSPHIDVIGNSDDEIVIETEKEFNETDGNNITKSSVVDVDSVPKLDTDYISESSSTPSALVHNLKTVDFDAETSDSDTDAYEDPRNSIDMSFSFETKTESEQKREGQENRCDLPPSRETEMFKDSPENDSADSYNGEKNKQQTSEQKISEEQKLSGNEDSGSSRDLSVESNGAADVGSSGDSSRVTSEPSTRYSWTSNPLYEARPLLMTESSDRGFGTRDISASDQDYIINLPRDRTPAWELISPNSPVTASSPDTNESLASPDWWQRRSPISPDGDFLPED